MFVFYSVMAAYYAGFGHYYFVICQTYIRWILDTIIVVILEYGVIFPTLYLHHMAA